MTVPQEKTPLSSKDRIRLGLFIGGFILFVLAYAGYLLWPSVGKQCAQDRVLKTGVEAEAVIVDLEDTGNRFNKNPEVRITVNVQPRQGSSFDAHVLYVMSPVEAPKFKPGKKIKVKYDPESREDVAIVSVPW